MRLNPKKKVERADLGDFGRGDPYNNNSSYETQPSSVSPTHRETKATPRYKKERSEVGMVLFSDLV